MNNDNPPAFPCGYHRDGNSADQTGGLTMRDYFAAMALMGLCANPDGEPEDTRHNAIVAYRNADAMLLARNTQHKSP